MPAPGEPGSETWPGATSGRPAARPVWVTGNYDPATRLAFWGTGNGGPWMGDQRPGDNLYTASTIAIDVATGRIRGHYQYHPNDSWDWDEVSPPILVDYRRGGRTFSGLVNAARDGYLWFLERTDGPIKFVEGKPFVKQNVFRSLDPRTGTARHRPGAQARHRQERPLLPVAVGRQELAARSPSVPQTRMIYIPANENLCATIVGEPIAYAPGSRFTGATSTFHLGARRRPHRRGAGLERGSRAGASGPTSTPTSPNWGPMLATGGGLVFSGGTNDRLFHAFDAASGELLWEFPTNSGITGQPSSFGIDGRQYIAVQSGWGVDARSMQNRLNEVAPGRFPEVPEGGAIWVFALP